jgi:PleD family two-component response regulator
LFAIFAALHHFEAMSKPLALLYYSNLLPGSQLVGRLQDMGYRVRSVSEPGAVLTACEDDMPLVIIAELTPAASVCAVILQLRKDPATQHIPVLAFAHAHDAPLQTHARDAGVTLLAADTGIADQLPRLLEQVLQVE